MRLFHVAKDPLHLPGQCLLYFFSLHSSRLSPCFCHLPRLASSKLATCPFALKHAVPCSLPPVLGQLFSPSLPAHPSAAENWVPGSPAVRRYAWAAPLGGSVSEHCCDPLGWWLVVGRTARAESRLGQRSLATALWKRLWVMVVTGDRALPTACVFPQLAPIPELTSAITLTKESQILRLFGRCP